MASINGVAIKNYKTFCGFEGEASQGTIYLNGKRLGFWSQDGNGGPDRFDFKESVLKDACERFKSGFPTDYKYINFCDDAEVFLGELARLTETERYLKRYFNKGYRAAVVVSNSWMSKTLFAPIDGSDAEILTAYAKDIEGMKAELDGKIDVSVFKPNSFDCIVDADHKVPTFLMSR